MYRPDYYAILGVSSSASTDDIKRAFRACAKTYHPDVSTEYNAEEKFKQCYEAYEILSDNVKRSHYDNIIFRTADTPQEPQYQQWQNEAREHAEKYAHVPYENVIKAIFVGGKFLATVGDGVLVKIVKHLLACALVVVSITLIVSTYGLILLVFPIYHYLKKSNKGL
jgi:DnaJ-class molecular chaperone